MTDSKKPDSEDEKKIVVDTDWKEQVAKEKQQAAQADSQFDSKDDFVPLKKADGTNPAEIAADKITADEQPAGTPSELEPQVPPPASLEVLVSMLFTQAMACLGQMPDPTTGKPEVNKPFAKHYIDTLEMLGEKTKGNTTKDETKILSEALHALRMGYVSVKA